MPVLRSEKSWTTRDGKRRRVRLYGSWCNLNNRIAGNIRTGRNGLPIWAGLECEFTDWFDFRAWALANGYSKLRCSLDRERSRLGYIKSNVRWVTVLENSTFANLIGHATRRKIANQQRRGRSAMRPAAALGGRYL